MKRAWILISYIPIALFLIVSLLSCNGFSSRNPEKVVKKYFNLVTKQSYGDSYEYLSNDSKKDLAQKHGIKNAKQYQEFRDNSEAFWSDFEISKRLDEREGKVVFVGKAKVEETGNPKSYSSVAQW